MSVLVLGEALVDVIHGRPRPGGSPMNVAVGLARLGVPTTLHTSLGRDDAGLLVERHLRASGVMITPESWADAPTSVAEVKLDAAGSPSYRFDIIWDPTPLSLAAGPFDAVHVGSIGAVLRPGTAVVDAILDSCRPALISYDINARPALMEDRATTLERVEQVVARSDIVKASDEDIQWLYPELEPNRVLERWLGLGARLAVLTRGSAGAIAMNPASTVTLPALPVAVRDTVGAGDSFMAGMLVSLAGADRERLPALGAEALARHLTLGLRCAAITVTREGADPPWSDDLRTQ